MTFCLLLCSRESVAQLCPAGMTCLQLFGAVNGAPSLANASFATSGPTGPYAFNSTTVNLTCNTTPIVATLSGPYTTAGVVPTQPFQPGGNLLVDNDIIVTVTPASGNTNVPTSFSSTPTNICTGGTDNGGYGATYGGNPIPFVPTNLSPNCFGSGYSSNYTSLNGQDPDTFPDPGAGGSTFDYAGGVAPLSLVYPIAVEPVPSPQYTSQAPAPTGLIPGAQSITIAPTDEGGVFASSSIFLTTNCVQGPVTGPAQVSGNPITSNTGTPQGLNQPLTFNPSTTNGVTLVYDLTKANGQGTLTGANTGTGNNPSPVGGDSPVDPTTFQTTYVPSTSFATSKCILHSGEALANTPNVPACKLYTLECTLGTNAPAGANCPVSTQANEVIEDLFDGPQFNLQNIYTPGDVFHEGIGLLMAADGWASYNAITNPAGLPGGPCTFSVPSGLASLPCPQNLLISFSGPGGFGGVGQTTNPNSTFISVYGVPEDKTYVYVAGEWPDNWVNNSSPKVYFSSEAPSFTKGAYVQNGNKLVALPNYQAYIPAPIQSITYGVTPAGSVPLPVSEPIAADTPIINPLLVSHGCPTLNASSPTTEPNFTPAPVTLPTMLDGQYVLHYYAQDCAGTQELLFTQAPGTGSWSTNFYTLPINIDTQKPTIALTPNSQLVQGGSYSKGAAVNAIFSCADPNTVVNSLNTGSGLVLCGTSIYAPQSKYTAGPFTTKINTSSTGPKTFTAYAIDGAGNMSTLSVNYTVH